MLSIDYEMADDKIKWSFIIAFLEGIVFSPTLYKMVSTLMNEIVAAIKINDVRSR